MIKINQRLQVNGASLKWGVQLEIYHTRSTALCGAVTGSMAKARHIIKTSIPFAAKGMLVFIMCHALAMFPVTAPQRAVDLV